MLSRARKVETPVLPIFGSGEREARVVPVGVEFAVLLANGHVYGGRTHTVLKDAVDEARRAAQPPSAFAIEADDGDEYGDDARAVGVRTYGGF